MRDSIAATANTGESRGGMTAKDTGIRMSFSDELQPVKIKVIGEEAAAAMRSTA